MSNRVIKSGRGGRKSVLIRLRAETQHGFLRVRSFAESRSSTSSSCHAFKMHFSKSLFRRRFVFLVSRRPKSVRFQNSHGMSAGLRRR
uniref:Uncharacterized protein n=1 Tax=Anguilla anguilla TaxID=7936 RepID=A0A0E9RGD0_ANGAN